jgi:hypothetical protein
MSKHRIILIVIVLTEIVLGTVFLLTYHQIVTARQHKEAASRVAVINTDSLATPEGSQFKYYFEIKPNTVDTDPALWLPYRPMYRYNSDGLSIRERSGGAGV